MPRLGKTPGLKELLNQDRVNVSQFLHAVLVDIVHPAAPLLIARPVGHDVMFVPADFEGACQTTRLKLRENNLKPIQDYESNPVYCG